MYALQLATAGLAIGSVYALIAIGVVLIYKCSGVVNFAQGAFVMLGAYFTYAITRLGLTPVIAVFLSTVLMAAAGAATERLVLRPMLKAPVVAIMMVTLGVLIFLRAVALAVWGRIDSLSKTVSRRRDRNLRNFITYNYLTAGSLAICLALAFLAFYRFTAIGLMQRCTADNSRAALAIGIHTSNQISLAWSMSACLAGLGGTLLATLNGLSLGLSDIGLIAFPVIVLGGLTSLAGAVVAGLLLGVLQAFTDGLITPMLEGFLPSLHHNLFGRGAATSVAIRPAHPRPIGQATGNIWLARQ